MCVDARAEKNLELWCEDRTVKRDVKGIFHACQVGSGLKRTECVCDAEAWDSRDRAHR